MTVSLLVYYSYIRVSDRFIAMSENAFVMAYFAYNNRTNSITTAQKRVFFFLQKHVNEMF